MSKQGRRKGGRQRDAEYDSSDSSVGPSGGPAATAASSSGAGRKWKRREGSVLPRGLLLTPVLLPSSLGASVAAAACQGVSGALHASRSAAPTPATVVEDVWERLEGLLQRKQQLHQGGPRESTCAAQSVYRCTEQRTVRHAICSTGSASCCCYGTAAPQPVATASAAVDDRWTQMSTMSGRKREPGGHRLAALLGAPAAQGRFPQEDLYFPQQSRASAEALAAISGCAAPKGAYDSRVAAAGATISSATTAAITLDSMLLSL
ncbi:hypothetical protein cyc_06812 [Cyclospora cayetanensis]|uniref:Uncharacterized protein n=1 Tax=Cyclospora cayetanensis TaxID=88456 RepID=A0A1D3CXR8_9EIME|nr:hypothetical protein cyc_06812 [Cyclospora cayetanensis]